MKWIQCTAILLFGTACGGQMGYRWSYQAAEATGIYGGPRLGLAVTTAGSSAPADSRPYLDLAAAYNFAQGPDFALAGGGPAWANATGRQALLLLNVSLEFMNGLGVSAALCGTYGNWGLVGACGRWGSKGYVAGELMVGFSEVRLSGDVHETARENGSSGGSDSDFDWD